MRKQFEKLILGIKIYMVLYFGGVFLASIQHTIQCCFFSTRNRQLIGALDLDPRLGVGAVEARQGRLPLIGAPVALGAI